MWGNLAPSQCHLLDSCLLRCAKQIQPNCKVVFSPDIFNAPGILPFHLYFSLCNAIAVHEIINSNDNDFYLHVRLFSEISQNSTRQSDAYKFELNKVSKKCDKVNFTYSSVFNWNNLPNNVTAYTESNVFHKFLMSHIFSQLG